MFFASDWDIQDFFSSIGLNKLTPEISIWSRKCELALRPQRHFVFVFWYFCFGVFSIVSYIFDNHSQILILFCTVHKQQLLQQYQDNGKVGYSTTIYRFFLLKTCLNWSWYFLLQYRYMHHSATDLHHATQCCTKFYHALPSTHLRQMFKSSFGKSIDIPFSYPRIKY